ncbi:AAA family ATPase [Thalassotalea fusca]
MDTLVDKILSQVESVVIGKPNQVKLALACLLADGHLLIEDLPGMGKTTLAHVLATTLGLSYQRIQFTSDLLPADVIGVSIFNQNKHAFELHRGPIFNQVVLADEINRASPKTQSALLEAMEENSVSIDGTTYGLPKPFFVIATQNPTYHAGTFPLPESQLDRFTMRISLGFPDVEAEKRILRSNINNYDSLKACISVDELTAIQQAVADVHVAEVIFEYVIALFQYSRDGSFKVNPLSPRAGKALLASAKAWAFMHLRDHVLPEDIQAVFSSVCLHRLRPTLSFDTEKGKNVAQQILALVDTVQPLSK